jgi:hypothetical protein
MVMSINLRLRSKVNLGAKHTFIKNREFKINIMKTKRAQMKIQEMSFMILALVLFLILVGLFYLVFSNTSLKNKFEDLTEAQTKSAIIKLSDLPELNCGENLCVDLDKIILLKQVQLYDNYWELGGLVIRKTYPYQNSSIECSAGSYLNCNTITLKAPQAEYDEISSFVSLCWKETKLGESYQHCELGTLSAYVEQIK